MNDQRSELVFIDGLIAKEPLKKDGTRKPDFIIAELSIKRQELIGWLQAQQDEWINADIKVSKSSGKWYASVNDFQPSQGDAPGYTESHAPADAPAPQSAFANEDVPF